MKSFFLGVAVTLAGFILLFIWLHTVGARPRHRATAPSERYASQLKRTEARAVAPEPGGAEARRMVEKVERAFAAFTPDKVRENFREAYAEEVYFRDAFHTYTDREALIDYMVKSAEMSPGVTFEFGKPGRDGVDFYLPWTMVLPRGKNEAEQRSIGVTRLRFNSEGKVVFHQDYWDSADVLVPKVPVANGLIELVRRRF